MAITTRPLNGQLQLELTRPSLQEPLLTAADAAQLLAVRVSWIYEATRDGRLPHIHVGRHIRFLRSDLEAWVAKQRAGE
ncbi:helix-turn-helix domain-containing protein [Paraconexibacter sp.]|uniref:helix-turn-helix domain-containing protein n=1 Tax=Paraconexibacter sp. TaxID=2949640 RepID=UPI0035637E23